MQHSRSQTVADAAEQLAGPVLLRMIHTQPGAYAACALFTHGTAKDRKKAVKAMKGASEQLYGARTRARIHNCPAAGHMPSWARCSSPAGCCERVATVLSSSCC